MPDEYFRLIGIKRPPANGEYFVTFFNHLNTINNNPGQDETEKRYKIVSRIQKLPWKARDFPQADSWLKKNKKPLDLMVRAAQRSDFFSPAVPLKDKGGASRGLISVFFPETVKCREVTVALISRAMLRMGEGKHAEAMSDLLASHRLARHVAQGHTAISSLIAYAMESLTLQAEAVFLSQPKVTAVQVKELRQELEKLAPMPGVAVKIDVGERFIYLDCILLLKRSKDPTQLLAGLGFPLGQRKVMEKPIDWNPALRQGNQWIDTIVKVLRIKDRATRQKEMKQITRKAKELELGLRDPELLTRLQRETKSLSRAKGTLMGQFLASSLIPTFAALLQAQERLEQQQSNLEVAVALALYQRDKRQYPKQLQMLSPKYLKTIPKDVFSGKALIYRSTKDGYLLYSVGLNGNDDAGQGPDFERGTDDLVITIPVK